MSLARDNEAMKDATDLAKTLLYKRTPYVTFQAIEDAVQLAAQDVIKADVEFKSNKHLFSYLYVAAKRNLHREIDKNRQHLGLALTYEEGSPEQVNATVDVSEVVAKCVDQLSKLDRQILSKYYLGELTDKQIATSLDLKDEKTAWRKRHKAIANLRQLFLQEGVTPNDWGMSPSLFRSLKNE